MNMQNLADKCAQKFLDMAETKLGDTSTVPVHTIKKYCRMLIIYCDAEGKVTESFIKSMEKCGEEIIAVEGMEAIFHHCNECAEDQ